MITYRIDVADAHAHLFRVTLSVPKPAAQQTLSLPVWIPGSYLVREFARHLSAVEAKQGEQALPVEQLDKASWRIACDERGGALSVSYLAYAFDTSVRAAYLDARRGFFNGTSVFLRVHGRETEPQRVQIGSLPTGWEVATAMRAAQVDARGRGRYESADYDELVDHPFELGTFWRGHFEAAGVPHEFVVAGALPTFDGERLLADVRRICEAEIAFWHGSKPGRTGVPPFDRYVFLLNVVGDAYGGLEHRASTALIGASRDLPRRGQTSASDGYVTLLGLVSHEYFHTWNVKRLKPASFRHYDYTQENYTELLWFFEGFTSYYDDLLLLRAGLIDGARYLKLVAKTLSGVLGTPGRQVQSVAQASFDAWVKYYRGDENTHNATVSYYTKGSLVALALDLSLRAESKKTLDDVMRTLWATSGGGPITEQDILQALSQAAGRSMAPELAAWVHGTEDLPLEALLALAGVQCKADPLTLAQRLGLRVAESALTGVQVKAVLRGSAAEQAGFAAGDELIAANGWRLRRLDDLAAFAGPDEALEVIASRDQRVMSLQVPAPNDVVAGPGTVSLSIDERAPRAALALRRAWLGP